MGCECEEGWSGDLCDIQGDEEPECDLDYQNEGSCDFGVKGYKDSHDLLDLPVLAKKHENGMYCSCPTGFTGLKCEVDISHCHLYGGPNDHFCLNWVLCNPGDPSSAGLTKKFSCKCETSNTLSQICSNTKIQALEKSHLLLSSLRFCDEWLFSFSRSSWEPIKQNKISCFRSKHNM